MKIVQMNKKILFAVIAIFLLLVGCGNQYTAQQNGQSTEEKQNEESTTSDTIDYSKYIKKVWVVKSWTNEAYNYSSFCISKIANGEIEGKLSTKDIAEPDYYYYLPNHQVYLANLTGKINNDTAECQFSDKDGDKGNVKLVFKSNDEIEATIEYTDKSECYKDSSLDGNFLFKPYNLKYIDGFSPFNDQIFTVNLNSWGNVKFVCGKLIGGKHIPTEFYLTNEAGDILYNFNTPFPYNVDVKAVSCQDVNKDGLKDIIIIVGDSDDSSWQIAKVFFQKTDGSFDNDVGVNIEINDSGNNKYIKTVVDYLSKKF